MTDAPHIHPLVAAATARQTADFEARVAEKRQRSDAIVGSADYTRGVSLALSLADAGTIATLTEDELLGTVSRHVIVEDITGHIIATFASVYEAGEFIQVCGLLAKAQTPTYFIR